MTGFVTDFVGREIKAGDTIVYPVRRGSDMWLKKLVVQQIVDSPSGSVVSGMNDVGRRISLKNLNNCIVVN